MTIQDNFYIALQNELSESVFPYLNLLYITSSIGMKSIKSNTLIICPYGLFDGTIEDLPVELVDIHPTEGLFLTQNKMPITISPYKAFTKSCLNSEIDFFDNETGKSSLSVLAWKEFESVLGTRVVILTTIEFKLLEIGTRDVIKDKIREIIKKINISGLREKENKIMQNKVLIDEMLSGNPIPLILCNFSEPVIEKEAFYSFWDKLKQNSIYPSNIQDYINVWKKYGGIIDENDSTLTVDERLFNLSKESFRSLYRRIIDEND